MAEPKPLVGVLMGSKSDWEVMKSASETLKHFAIAHECRVLSAHRTPAATIEYVSGAESRGLEVIGGGRRGRAPRRCRRRARSCRYWACRWRAPAEGHRLAARDRADADGTGGDMRSASRSHQRGAPGRGPWRTRARRCAKLRVPREQTAKVLKETLP
jgi:hypothetical protein